MDERMDKHTEKWKAESELSCGKKTEGDDLVALGVIRTALPRKAEGFRCGRMGGLELARIQDLRATDKLIGVGTFVSSELNGAVRTEKLAERR
jgi:hypothetical protein